MADWVEYVLLVWDWKSSFPPTYFATLEVCEIARPVNPRRPVMLVSDDLRGLVP